MNKPLALPPASYEPSVADALDMAMDSVALAMRKLLDQRDDNHRFNETQRLSVIGQALGRQKARTSKRVDDFVQRRARYQNCYGGSQNDMADVENLAEEEIGGGIPIPHPGFVGVGRIPHPMQVPNPYGGGGDGLEMLQPLFTELMRMNERHDEVAEETARADNRLSLAKELDTLTKMRDRLQTDQERTVIQRRIDAILADLEKGDVEATDPLLTPPPPTRPIQIRCTGCDTVHGRHWVTDDGQPRACDICGTSTTIERAPEPPQTTQAT